MKYDFFTNSYRILMNYLSITVQLQPRPYFEQTIVKHEVVLFGTATSERLECTGPGP